METESSKDAIQILGIMRPAPDCLVSPACDLSTNKNSLNRNLVYVRRKHETELGKNRTSDKEQTADYPQSEQFQHKGEVTEQQIPEREHMNTSFSISTPVSMADMTPLSEAPLAPVFPAKHSNGTSFGLNSTDPSSKNSQGVNDLQWRVRFAQLNAYLENCDHSNQEAYNNWLRSSTPVERSRHAVELEKRAIQLVIEEGREMHRVNVLNILAKSKSSNNL